MFKKLKKVVETSKNVSDIVGILTPVGEKMQVKRAEGNHKGAPGSAGAGVGASAALGRT